jgi:transposase-like protein
MNKKYTKNYKIKHSKEAIRVSESQESNVTAYAKKHGIPPTTLHQWVGQYKRKVYSSEKQQSFVALKPSSPNTTHEEHVIISTAFCSFTVAASISSEDLLKVMKSIQVVSSCS